MKGLANSCIRDLDNTGMGSHVERGGGRGERRKTVKLAKVTVAVLMENIKRGNIAVESKRRKTVNMRKGGDGKKSL